MQKHILYLSTHMWGFQPTTEPDEQYTDLENYFQFISENESKFDYTAQVFYVMNACLYWKTPEMEDGYRALVKALKFIQALDQAMTKNKSKLLVSYAFEFTNSLTMTFKTETREFEMLYGESADFVRVTLSTPEIYKKHKMVAGNTAQTLLTAPDIEKYGAPKFEVTDAVLPTRGEVKGYEVRM